MDSDDSPEPATRKPRYRRPRNLLGEHAAKVIGKLQARFIKDRPDAIAALAELRRAIGEEPGATGVHEACWLPDELLESEYVPANEPSHSERALHTAVTLWALHQQSRHKRGMHVDGTSFAAAIQRLSTVSPSEETVHNRFAALGTSTTYGELGHHARSVVVQLREADIGFDYGLLADDLRVFQRGADPITGLTGPERIRSLWGREYWRSKQKPSLGAEPLDKE